MKHAATIGAIVLGVILVVAGVTWERARASEIRSGLSVGETLLEFRPWHASGPDKGTMECPLCKYPTNPGVEVWVNSDVAQNVLTIASNLDKSVAANSSKKLKAFVVYTNVDHVPDHPLHEQVAEIATWNNLNHVALMVLGSWDKDAAQRNGINLDPQVRNTVYVYKRGRVRSKFVNLVANASGLAALDAAINRVLR